MNKNNVVLFEPRMPQNTGNIARTCVALNYALHIINPSFDLSEKAVKRAGLDYWQYLEIYQYDTYEEFLNKNPQGVKYFYTRYSKQTYYDIDFSDKVEDVKYYVFGSEDTGIPKSILQENLDTCLRIPMSENVRSLNLSNCVALVCYDSIAKQDFLNLSKVEIQKGEDFLESSI